LSYVRVNPPKEVIELITKWKSFEKWMRGIGSFLLLITYAILFLLWVVSMAIIK
tara:strand:+ start:3808 stop:3969 length:162 start_codon:yes stop_codon:yes gene_type:complete